MSPRRLMVSLAAAAVAIVVAIGLVQLAGSGEGNANAPLKLTSAQLKARLAGSPEPLASLHEQASTLLSGGTRALDARLAALRGRPIVINKWASWCTPCHEEVASFQRASLKLGREVAFIGIDSLEESRAAALSYLHSFPVSYPSYYDPSDETGIAITGSSFLPVTTFYDARGGQYTRQGPYLSQGKLEQDIRRYALDG